MSLSPSTLIFDLDGTLVDSKPGILEGFGAAAAAVFPGWELNPASVMLGPPIKRMFEVSYPAASEAQIESLVGEFRRHYDREGFLQTRLYEGARDVLARCKKLGVALDIATNKPLHISTAILSYLKIDAYFRSVLASDSAQPPFACKAQMIRSLLKTNRLNREETLYAGDSAEDAAGCAACGIRFVWAAYGYGKLTEQESKSVWATIHKPAELIGLLG